MRCLLAVSFALAALCLAHSAEAVNCVSVPLPSTPVAPVYTLDNIEGISGTTDFFRVDLWRQRCDPASNGPSFIVLVRITPLSQAPFVCDANFEILQNNSVWFVSLSQTYPAKGSFCEVNGLQTATTFVPFATASVFGQPAQPDFTQAFTFQYIGHTNFNLNVPAGGVAGPLVAAILPSSRSVQVGGTPATAFVTIINSGGATAFGVSISLQTGIPSNFLYQTTDPATNVLTGTANTPADIPPGQAATFAIVLTPTTPFGPTDVAFNYGGTNTVFAVPILTGINTLLLSASAGPVPDIVALAASGDPGIVDIPGALGIGFFAVATVNVGATAQITASADTGAGSPPVTILICQTNPATAQCISAIGPTVTTVINAGATPTFSVFVTGHGNVPFDPANNRIFVRFKDSGGITRGSTSEAVRTH
jgi:hypothetical protein